MSSKGIEADPEKLSAIAHMEAPIDVSGVRRFLVTINQLAKFLLTPSKVTKPLFKLLQSMANWIWD